MFVFVERGNVWGVLLFRCVLGCGAFGWWGSDVRRFECEELREVLVGIEKTEGYFFHSSVRGLFVLCVFGTEPETCKGSSYPQHALLSSGGSLYSCTNCWGWPVDLGS